MKYNNLILKVFLMNNDQYPRQFGRGMGRNLGKLQEMVKGQGGLVCCDPWGRRVRHDWVTTATTKREGFTLMYQNYKL